METELEGLAERLYVSQTAAESIQNSMRSHTDASKALLVTGEHITAFADEAAITPSLIRHIVDGTVGDPPYATCLSTLSRKVALYSLSSMREAHLSDELVPVIRSLVKTAIARVRTFLVDRIGLLKRPNTNVNIVKESVLLRHRALVEFVELHAPDVFMEIRREYVDTMSRTYFVLFRKYAAGLLTMKEALPAERADTLVGSLDGMFAKHAGVGQFALGDRLAVLTNVEGPAIVLATAVDNGDKFYYETIHRSLGKMLSETCASEHVFCREFFGESEGRMFDSFFRRIVGFLLEAVKAHTEPTRDTIGVLLALKVNEAQRKSMQEKKIMDLSDYFIQVDILLKPKFKKLLDENVASMSAASTSIMKAGSQSDTGPHIVTRRFAEFSASVLAIARFGTPDDSILEGLRRLRAEYNGFLNAVSTLYTRAKLRYVFLINNVDFLLAMFLRHGVAASEDYRSFHELQDVHTAAYVEHEVADHFPDMVTFVRQYERAKKASGRLPAVERVAAVLRQFAVNWKLGVQHMQEGVLREFPSFELGQELQKSLFARLIAYHKRCETSVEDQYPRLRVELVTNTEIVYELRQRSRGAT